jgi:uncharacterized RDD family membrane protein YckC
MNDDPFLHDQLTIDTPEQVAIRFPVAGLGSRFLAVFTDGLIQTGVYLALFLLIVLIASSAPKTVAGAFTRSGEKWFFAGLILISFLMHWGYFTLFEAFKNGQTPGKMIFKLRVIKDSGRQITLFESMTRNLIRIVDMLPSAYLIGVIAMMCNRQNQRLGDLAAGTLVVHERSSEEPMWGGTGPRTITASALAPMQMAANLNPALPRTVLPADAVAQLTVEDLGVIDRFLSRVLDMDLTTRARLAERLAGQMAAKMQMELPANVNPERVLEAIAYQMRAQGIVR